MVKEGQTAPDITLPDADMELVRLADFKGKRNVVLYFYPKDDMPGCTLQAIEFGDLEEKFSRHATVVLGVSRDDCLRHAAFRDKHGLTVGLLSDSDGEACAAYGVWQEKECGGVRKMGIVRSTFVIDKQGLVRHALYNVNPKGHAAEVLALIKEMK